MIYNIFHVFSSGLSYPITVIKRIFKLIIPIIKFKEIILNQHEKVDTEEGESIEEEENSTTSSDKSEQNSESGITTEDEEEPNKSETHQVPNVLNETIHDEENSSQTEDHT